jgi:hypothetical protein
MELHREFPLVKMELKREAVLLSGESNVNQALQPCPVKHSYAYFKRLAVVQSRAALKTHRAFICTLFCTVLEASLLLNCSDSHLYTKISAAKKKATKYPIPFLDLDGVYVFPREKLIEWAEQEKERKPLKSTKRGV